MLQRVESPDLVDPEDVIRMPVREQQRIDVPDVERQRLGSKVGPGVDEDAESLGRSRPAPMAEAVCRVDPSSGTRRNRTRSSGRRSTCPSRGR